MNAVIDRLVQYPNRFQLTNISDGTVLGTFDLSPVTGTVSVVGTILNHDLFQSIADDLASRIKTEGGVVSNTIETFTMAGTRTNISSGETISVSFGKIAKIINDLKQVAFTGDKSDVGLGNVDNTSDDDKPVSNATEIELNKKVDKVAGSSLMTDAEHNKLSGIADGAEVNVNADWNATSGDAVILNKPTIPNVPVQSVNSKTGAVVLTGSDIATSSADSEKLDSKSVANMLHLGACDSYTYDGTTGKYTVTRKTTYNNDGTQSESSSKNIETLYDRYFARTGQQYIEEWKKSEADRSSNLCDNATFLDSVTFFVNCSANYSNGQLNIVSTGRDSYMGEWGISSYNPECGKRINVKPDTTYTLSTGSSDINKNFITLYDSNGTMVSNIWSNDTNITTFTTPSTCAFITIRVGYESSVAGTTYPFNIMLNTGSVALPYQPYEGEVVHEKELAETLSAYPTSQSASETYLSKTDASTTYMAKSSIDSVPTENSTNPITSGGVYTAVANANATASEGLAKKLDKGDWREYQFDYAKNTEPQMFISPALENGTYICEILARGTGDYSAITTCYSLGVFSGYGTIKAYVGGMTFAYGAIHNLSAYIDNPLMTVRGDLDFLQEGPYDSFIRFRKIADD